MTQATAVVILIVATVVPLLFLIICINLLYRRGVIKMTLGPNPNTSASAESETTNSFKTEGFIMTTIIRNEEVNPENNGLYLNARELVEWLLLTALQNENVSAHKVLTATAWEIKKMIDRTSSSSKFQNPHNDNSQS